MKFIKPGKVAVVLQGRYAGKKAVVIKNHDEGNKAHPFPHAVLAGIERYPLKVTKAMSSKKISKRSRVKPFIKVMNYNHLMPTRYSLDLENTKSLLTVETFKEPTQRKLAKKAIRKMFEDKYKSGKNKWFFTKLRF